MKLTIQDACKSYEGRPVLEQLCLALPGKGTVCLFGPSGCGKTTLFNCIAGLEKLDSGAILGMEGRRVAYMFQEDRLLPWINARENVEVVLRHADEKQAQKWLEAVGLGENGDKRPSELSGGMIKRVGRYGRADREIRPVYFIESHFHIHSCFKMTRPAPLEGRSFRRGAG